MGEDPNVAYKVATALSVAPGRLGDFFIPADKVDQLSEHPHGYQGYGIAAAPESRVITTDYGFGAVRVGRMKQTESGLSFDFLYFGEAKGAGYRMFPDVLRSAGANRLQTANWGPDGQLWITRNSDGRIYVLAPEADGYRFAFSVMVDSRRFFLSAQFDLDREIMHTVEATLDCTQWFKCMHSVDLAGSCKAFQKSAEEESAPFLYGVGRRRGDDESWYITDSRCTKLPHGIYHGNKLVIPGYTGGGLCFLPDRSCLISYYGYEDGRPGSIIRIPASVLAE